MFRIFGVLLVITVVINNGNSLFEKFKSKDEDFRALNAALDALEVTFDIAKDQIPLASAVVGLMTLFIRPKEEKSKEGEILSHVIAAENNIQQLGHDVEQKIEVAVDTILNYIDAARDSKSSSEELGRLIRRIERDFLDAMKIKAILKNNQTVSPRESGRFISKVLNASDRTQEILINIHQILVNSAMNINSNFLSRYFRLNTVDYSRQCDKFASAQQSLYYVHLAIIATEMKGLAAISAAYYLAALANERIDKNDIRNVKIESKNRIAQYVRVMEDTIKLMPRDIRRCDPPQHKRGETFVELEGITNTILFEEPSDDCRGDCYMSHSLIPQDGVQFDSYLPKLDCAKIEGTVNKCISPKSSPRVYEWFSGSSGTYGIGKDSCQLKRRDEASCALCMCTVFDVQDVNIAEVVSDTSNNMIVTGVSFTRVASDRSDKGALSLRIKQGKLKEHGEVTNNAKYETVNDVFGSYFGGFDSEMYLTDVFVPSNMVVTGVSLQRSFLGRFTLRVRGTPFNFETGTVESSNHQWFSEYADSVDQRWSTSDRSKLGDLHQIPSVYPYATKDQGNPTNCQKFQPHRESRQLVKFYPSSRRLDAGQTSVPLFDAQENHVNPGFPLSGVGLYYKSCNNYGGMIAIRLFTADVTQV